MLPDDAGAQRVGLATRERLDHHPGSQEHRMEWIRGRARAGERRRGGRVGRVAGDSILVLRPGPRRNYSLRKRCVTITLPRPVIRKNSGLSKASANPEAYYRADRRTQRDFDLCGTSLRAVETSRHTWQSMAVRVCLAGATGWAGSELARGMRGHRISRSSQRSHAHTPDASWATSSASRASIVVSTRRRLKR